MKHKLIKANANGNNFIIINQKKIERKFIIDICQKYNTDGFISLNSSNNNEIIMDYFNNDASWETLCINGLTCVGLILNNQFKKNTFLITCGAKSYKIKIHNNLIKIEVPEPSYKSKEINVENYNGFYIDSGAKHFVIEIKNKWPNKSQLLKHAKKIRYNIKKFPNGINVNFFKMVNAQTIKVQTYEKGVEKLMSSCASGSYAAAYHFIKTINFNTNITIINNGGTYNIKFGKNCKKNYIINKAKFKIINE